MPHFDFDPSYGYSLEQLFRVKSPEAPADYELFWRHKLTEALSISPHPELTDTGITKDNLRVFRISFRSTNNATVQGWLCLPASGEIKRGFIIGHGYGGRTEPDFHLPFNHDSVLLFICHRGLSLSQHPGVSSQPHWHVLHDIDKPKQYIFRGCVEDIWTSVSCLLRLFPQLSGRIGLLGISFSGGIGTMALAWDSRIKKAHFNVPSFGNHLLRLALKTTGSGAAVQIYCRKYPEAVLTTLSYYDAAIAAKYINVPVHIAAARFDPTVAPPGQFAIYNSLNCDKQLFVLSAGHFEYPEQQQESQLLLNELSEFFADL